VAPQRLLILLAFLVSLIVPEHLASQIPGLSGLPATASQQAAPADPLGRDTPRGCILGFIKAAQENDSSFAIQYFEPFNAKKRSSRSEQQELTLQLLTILNQKFAGTLNFASRDPQGRLDDGLPPEQEKVNSTLGTGEAFPILLVRVEDEQGRKLWYFSQSTLDRVPVVFDTLTFPDMEKHIPDYLVERRLLSMPYWQWIAILLFIPLALFGARLLTKAVELAIHYSRKTRHLPTLPVEPLKRVGPLTFVLAILIHYMLVGYIGSSLLYRVYYREIILILLATAVCWLLTRITAAISLRIGTSLSSRGMYAERSIVSLFRRFVEVTIFVLILLIVLHALGVDVSAALAGVGIGTLALGLGAQKTFENIFGGVSVLFDKVIRVGDICKVNGQMGVVEDIGLRSTRFRTLERTMLSVPNGTMATAVLENLRFRDKFLFQQAIRLRYELSTEHVRFVLQEINRILRDSPKVEESSSRVRLLRFGEYALEIEIYCYILEGLYEEYLATQEGLLLTIMDVLEKAGAVVALPTQTMFVARTSWIGQKKARTAKAQQ
jgi:MscS family membrane protein